MQLAAVSYKQPAGHATTELPRVIMHALRPVLAYI
jgi:hypothetical protein